MAAHAHAAAARPADIAGRERDVHQRAVGAVVVVAPDQALLVGRTSCGVARRPAWAARSIRPIGDLIDREPGDLRRLLERRLVGGERLVEVLGRGGDEGLVGPALLGDVGQPGIEQREVGAGVDGEMHHAVLAGFDLAGIDGDGAARDRR